MIMMIGLIKWLSDSANQSMRNNPYCLTECDGDVHLITQTEESRFIITSTSAAAHLCDREHDDTIKEIGKRTKN